MSEAESESTVTTVEECVRTAQSGLSEYTESELNESAISESEPAKLNVVILFQNHLLNM